MNGHRRWAVVLVVALTMVMLTGYFAPTSHAESRAKYGGTLETSLAGDAQVSDPVAARSAADITLQGLLHEMGRLQPWLVHRPCLKPHCGSASGCAAM